MRRWALSLTDDEILNEHVASRREKYAEERWEESQELKRRIKREMFVLRNLKRQRLPNYRDARHATRALDAGQPQQDAISAQ